ncbi:hypothetical protein [Paenibacillus sp. R14(2021)]|uniref:hypothetical protein n=1 Tax=Paenibacillus sp. R14(2021) TaxID=2859228 RepID=UPI001C611D51|nr:hypothetical protein [Paenibacillus sp. R14(2021)]
MRGFNYKPPPLSDRRSRCANYINPSFRDDASVIHSRLRPLAIILFYSQVSEQGASIAIAWIFKYFGDDSSILFLQGVRATTRAAARLNKIG